MLFKVLGKDKNGPPRGWGFGSSAMGHQRRFGGGGVYVRSSPNLRHGNRHGRQSVIGRLSRSQSSISSARGIRDNGTSISSAFAVVRLITSSNLFGRKIGRSAGFVPFTRLADCQSPVRVIHDRCTDPAHQTYVRSAPKADQFHCGKEMSLCARRRHRPASFDDLVGCSEQQGWHVA